MASSAFCLEEFLVDAARWVMTNTRHDHKFLSPLCTGPASNAFRPYLALSFSSARTTEKPFLCFFFVFRSYPISISIPQFQFYCRIHIPYVKRCIAVAALPCLQAETKSTTTSHETRAECVMLVNGNQDQVSRVEGTICHVGFIPIRYGWFRIESDFASLLTIVVVDVFLVDLK